jgi:hypothetical protein
MHEHVRFIDPEVIDEKLNQLKGSAQRKSCKVRAAQDFSAWPDQN